jgi:hypothetical protein
MIDTIHQAIAKSVMRHHQDSGHQITPNKRASSKAMSNNSNQP